MTNDEAVEVLFNIERYIDKAGVHELTISLNGEEFISIHEDLRKAIGRAISVLSEVE